MFLKLLRKTLSRVNKYIFRRSFYICRIYSENCSLYRLYFRRTYLFHIQKSNKSFKVFRKRPNYPNFKRVFYLKIHRQTTGTYWCIKCWYDIAMACNAYVIFIVDKYQLQKDIVRYCIHKFKNDNFEFIATEKKRFNYYLDILFMNTDDSEHWKKVGKSMMTPFIHAYENNIDISYNIDADDIMLLGMKRKISYGFMQAEEYAMDKNIDLFNLDIFVSRSFGITWSFGVAICFNPGLCLQKFYENINWKDNQDELVKYNIQYAQKYNINVDWYFTYLRDTNRLNMGTFYIDNAVFIHMPDRILEYGWAMAMQWNSGKLKNLILLQYYPKFPLQELKINPTAIKIDANIKEYEYKEVISEIFSIPLYNNLCMFNDFIEYAINNNSESYLLKTAMCIKEEINHYKMKLNNE